MYSAIQLIGSVLLALVPALIWGYVFYKKQPESRSALLLVFITGALSVLPILFYRALWDIFPWLNAFEFAAQFDGKEIGISTLFNVPLSILITFMLFGVMEEVMKHFSIRSVHHRYFKNIDDVIEFAIVAALGFAFTENILYFYNIWEARGIEGLLRPFLFRSSFSTFAHIMFSGVFGYYYGVALFAKPILQEQIREKRSKPARLLYSIFHFHTASIFYKEKLFKGLVLATALHAAFNILLELEMTHFIVPYLVLGYGMLMYLFDKKESHKQYGLLMCREESHGRAMNTPVRHAP